MYVSNSWKLLINYHGFPYLARVSIGLPLCNQRSKTSSEGIQIIPTMAAALTILIPSWLARDRGIIIIQSLTNTRLCE